MTTTTAMKRTMDAADEDADGIAEVGGKDLQKRAQSASAPKTQKKTRKMTPQLRCQ